MGKAVMGMGKGAGQKWEWVVGRELMVMAEMGRGKGQGLMGRGRGQGLMGRA